MSDKENKSINDEINNLKAPKQTIIVVKNELLQFFLGIILLGLGLFFTKQKSNGK